MHLELSQLELFQLELLQGKLNTTIGLVIVDVLILCLLVNGCLELVQVLVQLLTEG